ncbi:putative MFS family arabinose efflux permease [Actinoplanes lutulentus]|uniref:Putative MFS family arabinose efflux permease n=1 Tax=Actinoplanes lutulentus TaxID=1287878 RepID=A0A327ZCM0_9ACTN|nr:MFS transporter [Actinoplanes lutulentus]MBB2947201.1 putative MFS family arabinose efflux permease [Actinoplanes lutulentus]RAK36476.1 putative MFS family arabinose efflux permease [Actinoplanes lutulentus]
MLRHRDFRCFWLGQTASQFGEHTSLVILPLIAVMTLGVSANQLGVLRAAGQAPLLLVALFAGVWVDAWRTRTVMACSDLARAAVMAVIVAAALWGGLGVPVLVAAAVVVGTLSVFFDVAYQAALVRLVSRDQLLRGNSLVEGSRSAAQMGGPALGAALVALSAPVAATVSAVLFAVSAWWIGRIRVREPIARRPRLREGVRFITGSPVLRAICLASAAFQFAFAATMTVYLLFLPRQLGLPGPVIGVVLAATGADALGGSLLAARLPSRFGYGPVLVTAAFLGDGVMLIVPALHGDSAATVAILIAVNLVFGIFGQLVNVTVMAVRQAVTPAALQGRVAATITFAGMGTTPLGSLLGGLLAAHTGLGTALALTSAAMLLSPVVIAASPLARLDHDPARYPLVTVRD